jgi:hypothetical protein
MNLPAPDALHRRLSLAFEFAVTDEDALTESIYQQRAETWRSTLTEEARAAGSSKTGQGPNGRDRDELRQMSRTDAQSIRNTFNRDLASQINQMYDAGLRSRQEFISALTEWADNRAEWKDRQIANQNRGTARTYAQERFNEENEVGEALYLFTGPPPREEECAKLFRAGLVNREFVERNPTPVHINCPHEWEVQVSRPGVARDRIWVG